MVKPVILLAGPTASGKSALALHIAQHFNGSIINADSMQVYADLAILSARPTRAEMADIPHHLYGHIAAHAPYNADIWVQDTIRAINTIWRNERLPIVTGGTGLYFKALTEGLSPMPDIPQDIRQSLRDSLKDTGLAALYEQLSEIDPDWAQKVKPTDQQRILRGLEVYHASGRPLSNWQDQPPEPPLQAQMIKLLLMPDRDWLYQRCDQRFHQMLETGALDEVKKLMTLDIPAAAQVLNAVGVAQLSTYLQGEISLATATRQAQQQTRNYAKRQMTWFRNQMATWESLDEKYYYQNSDKIIQFITEKGLTLS